MDVPKLGYPTSSQSDTSKSWQQKGKNAKRKSRYIVQKQPTLAAIVAPTAFTMPPQMYPYRSSGSSLIVFHIIRGYACYHYSGHCIIFVFHLFFVPTLRDCSCTKQIKIRIKNHDHHICHIRQMNSDKRDVEKTEHVFMIAITKSQRRLSKY